MYLFNARQFKGSSVHKNGSQRSRLGVFGGFEKCLPRTAAEFITKSSLFIL
jgi:hypothetical protein